MPHPDMVVGKSAALGLPKAGGFRSPRVWREAQEPKAETAGGHFSFGDKRKV